MDPYAALGRIGGSASGHVEPQCHSAALDCNQGRGCCDAAGEGVDRVLILGMSWAGTRSTACVGQVCPSEILGRIYIAHLSFMFLIVVAVWYEGCKL